MESYNIDFQLITLSADSNNKTHFTELINISILQFIFIVSNFGLFVNEGVKQFLECFGLIIIRHKQSF